MSTRHGHTTGPATVMRTVREALALCVCAAWVASCGIPQDDGLGDQDEAIGVGCTAARPTGVLGGLVAPDGRVLRQLLGVDLVNAAGEKVDQDGRVCGATGSHCTTGYSMTYLANPDLDAIGTTHTAGHETSHNFCVARAVTNVYVEIYPKNPAGVTDLTRYTEAVWASPVFVGYQNTGDWRVTPNRESGGNAGKINGSVSCDGAAVTPTRVNFWSTDGGTVCGVQGFHSGGILTRGFYTTDAVGDDGVQHEVMPGGQCGAPTQRYQGRIHAMCRGVDMCKRFDVDVANGAGPRVDVRFPEDDTGC